MDKAGIVTGHHSEGKRLRSQALRREATDAEALLWRRLKANGLDGLHFRRQQIIDGFIVDFYCHSTGVVVEVDGPVHDGLQQKDAERDAILTGRGLTVLHVTNAQVETEMATLLEHIRVACQQTASSNSETTGKSIVESPLPFREGAGG